jgi:hypothetical protein
VGTLGRVASKGALLIKMHGAQVTDVKLRIYQPLRIFEAFLAEHHCSEAYRYYRPDLRHLSSRVPDECTRSYLRSGGSSSFPCA